MEFKKVLPALAAAAILAVSAPHADAAPYSTAGHPKAHGLVITVDGPDAWERKESRMEHIVQRWVHREADHQAIIGIQVFAADEDIVNPVAEVDQLFREGGVWDLVYFPGKEQLVEKLDLEKTCKAGGCGLKAKCVLFFDNGKFSTYSATRRLWLVNRHRSVLIQLNVMGRNPAVLKRALNSYDDIWNGFVDSMDIRNWQ